MLLAWVPFVVLRFVVGRWLPGRRPPLFVLSCVWLLVACCHIVCRGRARSAECGWFRLVWFEVCRCKRSLLGSPRTLWFRVLSVVRIVVGIGSVGVGILLGICRWGVRKTCSFGLVY